jgi:DNA primase
VLNLLGFVPRKKSAIEFCCACLYCEKGTDRFTIWPSKGECGRFWCRVCDKKGDAINLLRDFRGLSFKEACSELRMAPKVDYSPLKEVLPIIGEEPSDQWINQAKVFVDFSHNQLLGSKKFLSALLNRGISLETVKKFKLGYNSTNLFQQNSDWGLPTEITGKGKKRTVWLPSGIVIPTTENEKVVKIKIRNASFKNDVHKLEPLSYFNVKYVVVKGSKKIPSIYGNQDLNILVILESELDAILLLQETNELIFCLALGGSRQPLDAYSKNLVQATERVLFCPDFDAAGKESWDRWSKIFPTMQRILISHGKDPTEAFQLGVNLSDWLLKFLNNKKENKDEKRNKQRGI